MPRKKSTITEEVVETPVEPEVDYKKDIENKSFEQIATAPEVKPNPVEEKAEEIKVEEKKPEEEFETVEFDPEQLKREAIAQAKKEIQEELAAGTKKETEEKKDEYAEFQKAIFEKEKRNPTYKEALDFVKDQAIKAIEDDNAKKAAKVAEEQESAKKTAETQQQSTNKYINDTLNDLYLNDKLPKIKDKNNSDDYGVRVQNELFKTIVEVNNKRLASNLPPKTLKEIFYEDFKPPEREVAGADAPVDMGRSGYTPDTETDEIDYLKDIRGKTMKQVAMQALNKVMGNKSS